MICFFNSLDWPSNKILAFHYLLFVLFCNRTYYLLIFYSFFTENSCVLNMKKTATLSISLSPSLLVPLSPLSPSSSHPSLPLLSPSHSLGKCYVKNYYVLSCLDIAEIFVLIRSKKQLSVNNSLKKCYKIR